MLNTSFAMGMFKTLLKTALVHRLQYSDFCIVSSYQEPARVGQLAELVASFIYSEC